MYFPISLLFVHSLIGAHLTVLLYTVSIFVEFTVTVV